MDYQHEYSDRKKPRLNLVPELHDGSDELNTDIYEYDETEVYFTLSDPFVKEHFVKKDYLNTLSDEMILNILSYLNQRSLANVAQVCKRLKRISMDKSLWQRINLSKKILDINSVNSILDRGVRVLKMSSATIHSSLTYNFNLAELEYLDLTLAVIKIQDLYKLLKRLRELKKLSLEGCVLNRNIMMEISKNENLITLNLAMCTGLCVDGIKSIAEDCHNLQSLNVAWTCMDENSISELVTHINPGIVEINLSGNVITLKDKHAITLIRRCTSLVRLDLSDCMELSKTVLSCIIDNLYRLETLCLSRCYRINPLSFGELKSLPNLKRLNAFRQLTKENINVLEKHLPGVIFNRDVCSPISRSCGISRSRSTWKIRTE